MKMDRRKFLKFSMCAGPASLLVGCQAGRDDSPELIEELNAAAAEPVLNLDGLTEEVIIDSIQLLKSEGEYFIRVRSKDGAEGISLHNGRAPVLAPVLTSHVIPYFIGKDARNIEEHLWELYRYQSNYKLQGLAFWSTQAWVEFAILDMLGRIAGKSYGEMLGGIIRKEVPFYVASGRRE